MRGGLQVAMGSILLGAGLVIGGMVGLGVIDSAPATLIPEGSIVIANAMNTTALALDRVPAEAEAHTGQIESGLALGAAPTAMAAPYVLTGVACCPIPRIYNF